MINPFVNGLRLVYIGIRYTSPVSAIADLYVPRAIGPRGWNVSIGFCMSRDGTEKERER